MTGLVQMTGPVFNGQAEAASSAYAIAAGGVAAQKVVDAVKSQLDGSLRHPTGYYRSHVVTDRSSGSDSVVSDGGVVYGPWLEGVGSRNQRTRFKGYSSFRKAAQKLDNSTALVGDLDALFSRYEGRME